MDEIVEEIISVTESSEEVVDKISGMDVVSSVTSIGLIVVSAMISSVISLVTEMKNNNFEILTQKKLEISLLVISDFLETFLPQISLFVI